MHRLGIAKSLQGSYAGRLLVQQTRRILGGIGHDIIPQRAETYRERRKVYNSHPKFLISGFVKVCGRINLCPRQFICKRNTKLQRVATRQQLALYFFKKSVWAATGISICPVYKKTPLFLNWFHCSRDGAQWCSSRSLPNRCLQQPHQNVHTPYMPYSQLCCSNSLVLAVSLRYQ